jgi:hypothetical protein
MENTISIITVVILFLTGVAIVIYTIETHKSTIEIKKSNKIRLRPVLNLYLRGEETNEYFALRNVGEITAYNIQIHPLEIEGYTYEFIFKEPNIILEPNGDEKRVSLPARKMPDGGIQMTNITYLKSHLFIKTLYAEELEKARKLYLSFLINYNNINGEKFYSVFKFYTKDPIVDDFVVEFMASGEGGCDIEKAKNICESRNKLN